MFGIKKLTKTVSNVLNKIDSLDFSVRDLNIDIQIYTRRIKELERLVDKLEEDVNRYDRLSAILKAEQPVSRCYSVSIEEIK